MGWPQVTIIVLITINLVIATMKHGESRGNYNVLYSTIDAVILVWLLSAGGFFP